MRGCPTGSPNTHGQVMLFHVGFCDQVLVIIHTMSFIVSDVEDITWKFCLFMVNRSMLGLKNA